MYLREGTKAHRNIDIRHPALHSHTLLSLHSFSLSSRFSSTTSPSSFSLSLALSLSRFSDCETGGARYSRCGEEIYYRRGKCKPYFMFFSSPPLHLISSFFSIDLRAFTLPFFISFTRSFAGYLCRARRPSPYGARGCAAGADAT